MSRAGKAVRETKRDVPLACRLEVLPGARVIDRLVSAERCGFAAVSLPGRFLDSYLEELRACLPDSPLPIAAVSLGFRGSLASPERKRRQLCRDSLQRMFDLCASLGARLFNMPPLLTQDNPGRRRSAGRPTGRTEAAVEDRDALLVEELPAVCDAARARDLLLLLEPVNRYESEYLNTLSHAARICEAVGHDHLGITCDFYHMQLEELNAADSILRAGNWIRHVHVAENTRVEPGVGSLRFAEGFGALSRVGYRGLIELECRSLSGPAEQVLPRSVRYLEGLWARSQNGSGASEPGNQR